MAASVSVLRLPKTSIIRNAYRRTFSEAFRKKAVYGGPCCHCRCRCRYLHWWRWNLYLSVAFLQGLCRIYFYGIFTYIGDLGSCDSNPHSQASLKPTCVSICATTHILPVRGIIFASIEKQVQRQTELIAKCSVRMWWEGIEHKRNGRVVTRPTTSLPEMNAGEARRRGRRGVMSSGKGLMIEADGNTLMNMNNIKS